MERKNIIKEETFYIKNSAMLLGITLFWNPFQQIEFLPFLYLVMSNPFNALRFKSLEASEI